MAQIEKMKDVAKSEQSGGANILHQFAGTRANGNKIIWAKPAKVAISSLQFVAFAFVLGGGCWALNHAVMYCVSLVV